MHVPDFHSQLSSLLHFFFSERRVCADLWVPDHDWSEVFHREGDRRAAAATLVERAPETDTLLWLLSAWS